MRISKRRAETILIIIILLMAIFNDVVRIPGTVISGYRLALPIVLCLALAHFQLIWKYFLFGGGMIFILIVQNIIFCKVFQYEETIDLLWQLRYLFYYFSIIEIFVLVRILRKNNSVFFQKIFYKGIPVLCIAFIVTYALAYVGAYIIPFEKINFTNLNDYGACLAAIFPWLLVESFFGKKKSIILCVVIMTALLLGDSKVALAGIVMQVAIIVSIVLIRKMREGNKVLLFLIPIATLGCLAIVLSPITINGYRIKLMFTGMISHIMKGKPYEVNSTSITIRTNAIIYMLRGIKDSHFIGIGIGNTGKLLRQLMPDLVSSQKLASITVSPHCAWLEFFCDCGIWAILLCLYIYMIAIKKLFQAKRLDKAEIFFVAFTLSFPIWIMSPSGIYTIYLIFIIIAWLYEWSRMKCQLEKKTL